MQRLLSYFTDGITSRPTGLIGMEVETSFIDSEGKAISFAASQGILKGLLADSGWQISATKGEAISELRHQRGDAVRYELGRQNIEVATAPQSPCEIIKHSKLVLEELYAVAGRIGAYPHFAPILRSDGNLLAVPDERDATWIKLDGIQALNALANTASVHFVMDVAPDQAIHVLNKLNARTEEFLYDFPQDANWRYYIANSLASYEPTRYGGPFVFASLRDYCHQLAAHQAVAAFGLVPFYQATVAVPLFLRSIWWHFRLRRYNDTLCVEARPNARYNDSNFAAQLQSVLQSF